MELLGLKLFEHLLSISYFSGTSLFPISFKAVSQLTIPANFASLLRLEHLKDCQEAGDNGDKSADGDKSVDGDDTDNLGKSLTTNCP